MSGKRNRVLEGKWAAERDFDPATLEALQEVTAEFAQDPSTPNLELAMRDAQANSGRRRIRVCMAKRCVRRTHRSRVMQIAFRWPPKFYPYTEHPVLPPDARTRLFEWARGAGFDGNEVLSPNLPLGPKARTQAEGIRDELAAHQLEAAAYRAESYNFTERATRQERLDLSFQSVEIASHLGAGVMNITLPGRFVQEAAASVPYNWMMGGRVSVGGARLATDEEFELTASALGEIADAAAEHGIVVSVEVHQYCYADSSEPALRILDRADRANVGANPDPGNIIRSYATPVETSEEAITRMAPRTVYVHVKNPKRVYLPDLDRAVYVQETLLSEGSIDWRFALATLAAAGYGGWLTIEGNTASWDYEWAMEQNVAYLRSVLERVGAGSVG